MSALVCAMLVLVAGIAPTSPFVPAADADNPPPKAVFIVGPANGMTDSNLVDAERMATQAEAQGMDVRRVFFPHATWEKVLANIQGANLVVYMGHGYGWPSPYTAKLTESRQNGMGLNSFDGSGKAQYTYFGATPIRQNVRLAVNAVVINVHLCYSAGNGEPGMAIPNEELARERVDNYANGWLAAGAQAVFAFGWNQRLDFPRALATSDMTIDQMFMSLGSGSPNGFIGTANKRFESQRTPGARNHLDPHHNYGYYRAVTGNLSMTAADWRAGTTPGAQPPPPPPADGTPPEITDLSAGGGASGQLASDTSGIPSFHPNGDGLDEDLPLSHTVTKSAYLDAVITDAGGQTVRSYSVWSASGSGTSRWDGKNNAGALVPDGTYTLTYTPRDTSGQVGAPVSIQASVLTAIAVAVPSKPSVYASDGDALGKDTQFKVTLNQTARLTWVVVNAAGATVRTVKSDSQTPAGVFKYLWDARSDSGAHVSEGWYRSVITAQTGLGVYSHERSVYVWPFIYTPSSSSPARGEKITVKITSTEALARNPTVEVRQPGVAPWTATAKLLTGKKYSLTVTLNAGGDSGTVDFLVSGVDKNGGRQSSTLSLPLR